MQNEELQRRAAAEEASRKYRDLFDFAPVGYFLWDHEGRILEVNLAAAALLGLGRGMVIEKRFGEFVAIEHRTAFAEFCQRVLATDAKQTCEVKILKDGQAVDVRVEGIAAQDRQGHERLCLAAVIDISQQKRADELAAANRVLQSEIAARKQAEEEIRSLAEFPQENPNPILRACGDGCVLYANQSAVRLLEAMGWQAGQPLLEELLRPVRRVLETGEKHEFDLLCAVGRTFSFAVAPSSRAGQVNLYARDITERKQAEEALLASREDLDRAQAVAQTGSWRLNVHRNELLWSDENWRMFGVPRDTPLNYETFLQMVHPDDRAYVHEKWSAALRGEPYDIEHRIVVRDQIKWVRERAQLEFDPPGTLLGGFGTTQDITAKKQAEEALAAAKSAAEAANMAKSQFLANMSHELRTPMNAIMGMTDLALQEELSPSVRDYLQTAKQSADSLLELLNEILDLSRIEAGGFQLESTPLDLRKTVDQVIKTLSVRAYEKGLELVCDLKDAPNQLIGDPLRLRQVLVNLVGNAVKFTSKGAVVVSVRAAGLKARGREPAESGNDEVPMTEVPSVIPNSQSLVTLEFSVADTGIGIALEDQRRIFAPFVQADASTTRHYGGTGLGLTIVSKLVELMGGRIWVESEPGKGSIFRFTARLHLQEGLEEEPALPAVSREALRDLPVLIVAENPTGGRILVETFRRWSMKPEAADDVPTALAKVHQAASNGQSFRLILADAVMPGLDGFTLAAWLRGDSRLVGPVILMLSAAQRFSQAKRCQDMGALCLEKPISQSHLFNVIAEALGIQEQAVKSADAASPPISPAPSRSLRVLLAEDTPANQKLASYVLSKRGHRVEVVQNGQQAWEAVGQQNFDAVLMDVQMPVMDGFQATQAIRKLPDPKKARLPIIAMTAHALKGDAERCLSAGMDGYISKPIKGEELIELVERLAEGTAGALPILLIASEINQQESLAA